MKIIQFHCFAAGLVFLQSVNAVESEFDWLGQCSIITSEQSLIRCAEGSAHVFAVI